LQYNNIQILLFDNILIEIHASLMLMRLLVSLNLCLSIDPNLPSVDLQHEKTRDHLHKILSKFLLFTL